MTETRSRFLFWVFLFDGFLVGISYFAVNFAKYKTLALSPIYIKMLGLLYVIWLFVSLFTRKFQEEHYKTYKGGVLLLAKAAIFILYCLALLVVGMGLAGFSRLFIFGVCGSLLAVEIGVFSIYYSLWGRRMDKRPEEIDPSMVVPEKKSVFLMVSDFFLITGSFFFMNYFKRSTLALSGNYEKILLGIYALWLTASLLTGKFEKRNYRNFYYAFMPYVKAVVLMAATTALAVFAFRLFYLSRLHIFGTFLVLFVSESVLCFLFVVFTSDEAEEDVESPSEVRMLLGQEELQMEKGKKIKGTVSVRGKLREKYLRFYPELCDLIDETVDLSEIYKEEAAVLNIEDTYNVENLDDHSLCLFINLHRVNDIRRVNRYFLEVHKKLNNGGDFVGKAETIDTHKAHFFRKYPRYVAEVFYLGHFVLHRAFPKLPWIKRIYFEVTKGKDRMISRAEVLGRLYFCGFKVIGEKVINDDFYFIAQKVKAPSTDRIPSYGPFIKLKRTGLYGKIFYVYKFRTMHPYSEYLQKYIYEECNLEEGGKIRNDFRITGWGKFFRKYWIDELPMLYNWLKGDLNLIGVRPLSMHYFSLYSDEMKELRTKVMPGLLPPFYADMPKTFAEICESEKRYILAYLSSPLKTQWVYFWRIFLNIVVKGARSN